MSGRLLVIGALAALSSGCSLVLVDGPPGFIPPDDPVPPGSCTIDRTIPLIDAAGAAGGLVTALTNSDGNAVRIGAVVGAVLGFSSYRGFSKVGQCRERMTIAPEGTSAWQAQLPRPMAPAVMIPGAQREVRPRSPGIEAASLLSVPPTALHWPLRVPGSEVFRPPTPQPAGG